MPVHPCESPRTNVAHGRNQGYSWGDSVDDARLRAILSASEKMMNDINVELAKHSCQPPCELRYEITERVVAGVSVGQSIVAPGLDQTFFPPETTYNGQALILWDLDIWCKRPSHLGGRPKGAPQPRPE
jgi:hypothetical protein